MYIKPILLLQTWPFLPDFCHPDVLVTWQQSAYESEKFRWETRQLLRSSWLHSRVHFSGLFFFFQYSSPITVHLRNYFCFSVLFFRRPPSDPWITPSGFTELPFSMVFSTFLLLCFLHYFKPSLLTMLTHSQWKETVRKYVSHVGYTFHNPWWLRHTLYWANYINLNRTLHISWDFHCSYFTQSLGKVKRSNRKTCFKQNKN